jgi:hypothetical protein
MNAANIISLEQFRSKGTEGKVFFPRLYSLAYPFVLANFTTKNRDNKKISFLYFVRFFQKVTKFTFWCRKGEFSTAKAKPYL